MKDVEKRRATIINVIYFAMILAIAFLLVRYALGVCLPFLIAFVLALLVQRPKNFLVRKTFLKNGAASVICVFSPKCRTSSTISSCSSRTWNRSWTTSRPG